MTYTRTQMKTISIAAALLSLPAVSALATPPAVEIDMAAPMKRRVTNIAEHDGQVTMAGERAAGAYVDRRVGPPHEELRRACLALPLEERLRCAECMPFERFRGNQEISRTGRASEELIEWAMKLCLPGHSQEVMRQSIEKGAQRRQRIGHDAAAKYAGLRLVAKSIWDQRILLGSVGVTADGRAGPYRQADPMVMDPETGRHYFAYDSVMGSKSPMTLVPSGVRLEDTEVLYKTPVLASPPSDARLLRFGVDLESSPENREVLVEELADRSRIEFDDMILYLKDEPFPADAPPLLEIDPAGLDPGGRRLQEAIKRHMAWAMDDENAGNSVGDVLAYYHPEERQIMRGRIERNLERDRAMRAENGSTQRINPLALGPGASDFVRDAPQMRIASRVFTDNGLVWFAWAPQPEADDPGDVFVNVIFQMRDDAGEYGFIGDLSRHVDGQGRDRRAMRILAIGGGDLPTWEDGAWKPDLRDIVGILTRHQREAQLGAGE